MAGDRTEKRTVRSTSLQRRRLSNITNLVNGGGWSNENEIYKSDYNTSDCQLQQEIKRLGQMNAEKDLIIAEKDQEVESQRLFMHRMQRDFYIKICKRAQQNEEIIGFNTRLSKELTNVREQLKMLHHEYAQMTLVYKINENELQTRLAEKQDQLNRAIEEKEKASFESMNLVENTITGIGRTSSARRRSMIGAVGLEPDICNLSSNTHFTSFADTTTDNTRGGPRPRGVAQSEKESSVKLKITQHDPRPIPILEPYISGPVAACSAKRYNNRYGHLNNLEPMQELNEESEFHSYSSSSSRRSQGSSSLEHVSAGVIESETIDQSSSNHVRNGEVASMGEHNVAGLTMSSEPRLANRMQRNLCDKNPLPSRLGSPHQTAQSSQPSTPRKRGEVHMISQKQAAVQPSTPVGTSPIRHADAPPASGSSLNRTRALSPCAHADQNRPKSQPSLRTSLGGRPSRRAAETVTSYKEPSLVSKMRRPH